MFKIEDVAAHLFTKKKTDRFLEKAEKIQIGEPVVDGGACPEAHSFLTSMLGWCEPPEIHPGVAENIRKFFGRNLECRVNSREDASTWNFLKGRCDSITTTTGGRVTITELVTGDEGVGIVQAAIYGFIHNEGFPIFDIVVFNPVSGVEYRINGFYVHSFISKVLEKINFLWVLNGVTYLHNCGVTTEIDPETLDPNTRDRVFYHGDEFDSIYSGNPKCVKFG